MVKTFYFILVVCVRLFISCVRSGLQSRRGIRKVESCPILKSRTCPRRCKSSTPWYVVGWCLLGSCGLIMHEDAWRGVPLLSPSLITLTAKTHAHTHTHTRTHTSSARRPGGFRNIYVWCMWGLPWFRLCVFSNCMIFSAAGLFPSSICALVDRL